MRKWINIIISTILMLLFLGVGYLLGAHSKDNEIYDLYHVYDSLRTLSNIRVDAELPYYGMKQDDVLLMLPEPSAVSDTMRLTATMEFDLESHGIYDSFLERLSGTADEINVMTFFWNFPDKDSTRLFIVFEWVDDSVWIANSCVQWKSNELYLD